MKYTLFFIVYYVLVVSECYYIKTSDEHVILTFPHLATALRFFCWNMERNDDNDDLILYDNTICEKKVFHDLKGKCKQTNANKNYNTVKQFRDRTTKKLINDANNQ